MRSKQSQIVISSFVVFLLLQSIGAFQSSSRAQWKSPLLGKDLTSLTRDGPTISSTRCESTRARQSEKVDEANFLMKEFSTASGEIVNPYKILKVPRDADRKVIREAYRNISKRYHPDRVRHSKVLPGKCNNLEDVEAEWERIQISYNILSEKKTRMQYDRHEVIADPGAAMQRAVIGAALDGVMGIGKGIFHIGSSTLDAMIGDDKKTKK